MRWISSRGKCSGIWFYFGEYARIVTIRDVHWPDNPAYFYIRPDNDKPEIRFSIKAGLSDGYPSKFECTGRTVPVSETNKNLKIGKVSTGIRISGVQSLD